MTSSISEVRARCGLLLTVFSLLAVGCGGPPQAKVSGRVTLGGKPLADGLVTFRPTPHTPGPEFSGRLLSGEYQVPQGVLPGDYVVDVRSWQKTGRIVKTPYGDTTDEIVNAIPQRYRGEGTELSTHLKPGANTVDFDLHP